MRLPLVVASLFCALSLACAANAEAAAAKDAADSLDIRVEGGGWGRDGAAQIETVLHAVAAELLTRPSQKLTVPIIVTHTESNPIALYDRGPAGEYLVRLHASDGHWPLYVFEFAHEFCHLLSNFDENVGEDIDRRNQWFEESLCETASLYALERLAARWERSPAAEWSRRASKLRSFFNLLVAEEHRRLPAQTRPAAWLSAHEEQLRRDPYLREQNDLVAKLLLPLFEQDRRTWDALRYLNLDPADTEASTTAYLRHWYDNSPAEHKSFVAAVMKLLGADDVPVAATPAHEQAAAVAMTHVVADRRP